MHEAFRSRKVVKFQKVKEKTDSERENHIHTNIDIKNNLNAFQYINDSVNLTTGYLLAYFCLSFATVDKSVSSIFLSRCVFFVCIFHKCAQ